jgi:hypothetical protein
MTSGIEPANFRLVAQCINQLRHRLPRLYVKYPLFVTFPSNLNSMVIFSKVPLFCHISIKLEFYGHIFESTRYLFVTFPSNLNSMVTFSRNPQISHFIILRIVVAELMHADRQTDRHDKAWLAVDFRKFA